jgi:glutaminyl-peptide cyclotransferase
MTSSSFATLRTGVIRLLPIVAVLACASSVPPVREFDGHRAFEYARTQLAFGPRIPGSPGHAATAAWLDSTLRARADTVLVQGWDHTTRDGKVLPMRNLLARFNPGATKRVMLLAHWDTRPRADAAGSSDTTAPVPGANDGASGVAILIGIADVLKAKAPGIGVDLLFVDGEDYGDFYASGRPDVLIGARYYADHPLAPFPKYAILLDMVGDRTLQIKQEGYSMSAAPDVVEKVWAAAARLGHTSTFVEQVGTEITDDHTELIRVGVPTIDVIDIDFPWHHTPDDTIDKISVESLQIVGDVMVLVIRGER